MDFVSRYVKQSRFGKGQSAKPLSVGLLAASLDGEFCDFRVWAPNASRITLRLIGSDRPRDIPMQREGEHFAARTQASAGDRYFYLVDDHKPVPDPVSRLLPEGVHGPTEIVDPAMFAWSDAAWHGLPLKDYIIYELHIGAFTPEGTLDAAIEKLAHLRNLGVTVVELMPVAAFPGTRNWGYDGVSLYAVQASYGGPEALRRFVDAAHARGLAVTLDVVYNHLGNEGNYLRQFGPYFTDRHKTPWGDAVNYDQQCCQGVRDYVIENALYWIREYHLDGLRLDAVQTIVDDSPVNILAEIKGHVAVFAGELQRQVCVIAETDRNDAKLVLPPSRGGYGLDALWSDDFHHAIHAFFTGERQGYFQDFGSVEQIVRALSQGFVFQGEPFKFWNGQPRGTPANGVPAPAHVFCLQNHDQVGNRPQGDRWSTLMPRGARMLAAALLLLSPYTPLLFMGEEFDECNPFLFFTDYGDPELRRAVKEGRHNEFRDFGHASSLVPDPQDPATFARCKLNWRLVEEKREMLTWYRTLLALRKKYVIDAERTCRVEFADGVIEMHVPAQNPQLRVAARLVGSASLPEPGSVWLLAAEAEEHGYAVRVFQRS